MKRRGGAATCPSRSLARSVVRTASGCRRRDASHVFEALQSVNADWFKATEWPSDAFWHLAGPAVTHVDPAKMPEDHLELRRGKEIWKSWSPTPSSSARCCHAPTRSACSTPRAGCAGPPSRRRARTCRPRSRSCSSTRALPATNSVAIQLDGEGIPHYLWWLRNDEGAFIAVVAVSTRAGRGRPVDLPSSSTRWCARPWSACGASSAQSALLSLHDSLSARDKDVDLLLKVTDTPSVTGGDKIDELKLLLQNAADHMNCALVALIVPDKNIAMMRPGKDRQVDGQLVARTHRQLLQLVTQSAANRW